MRTPLHHQAGDRRRCAALECQELVPPQLLLCSGHWAKLPHEVRARVKRHYRIGQERRHDASPEYMRAAAEAVRYLATLEGRPLPPLPAEAS